MLKGVNLGRYQQSLLLKGPKEFYKLATYSSCRCCQTWLMVSGSAQKQKGIWEPLEIEDKGMLYTGNGKMVQSMPTKHQKWSRCICKGVLDHPDDSNRSQQHGFVRPLYQKCLEFGRLECAIFAVKILFGECSQSTCCNHWLLPSCPKMGWLLWPQILANYPLSYPNHSHYRDPAWWLLASLGLQVKRFPSQRVRRDLPLRLRASERVFRCLRVPSIQI